MLFEPNYTPSGEEDLKDKEFNERIVPRLASNGQLEDCKSQDIRPGDIIRVNRNEELPCDILLLKSSDPKGAAFVMTANLDGETDLKLKKSVASMGSMGKELETLVARVQNELSYLIGCEKQAQEARGQPAVELCQADAHGGGARGPLLVQSEDQQD